MPISLSVEIAQHAHSFASTLFTLFFVKYFPIVAGAYLLISLLEQFYIISNWKKHTYLSLLHEIILLSGNIIWLWLALLIVPEMKEMVLNVNSWNELSSREAFSTLHNQSQTLAKIGLGLTMVLPWLSQISGMGLTVEPK